MPVSLTIVISWNSWSDQQVDCSKKWKDLLISGKFCCQSKVETKPHSVKHKSDWPDRFMVVAKLRQHHYHTVETIFLWAWTSAADSRLNGLWVYHFAGAILHKECRLADRRTNLDGQIWMDGCSLCIVLKSEIRFLLSRVSSVLDWLCSRHQSIWNWRV